VDKSKFNREFLTSLIKSELWWTICHPDDYSTDLKSLKNIHCWSGDEVFSAFVDPLEHVDGSNAVNDWVHWHPDAPDEGFQGVDDNFDVNWSVLRSLPWHESPKIVSEIFKSGDWYIPTHLEPASVQNLNKLKYYLRGVEPDRERFLAALTKDSRNLKYASDQLSADREIVLAAVNLDGLALEYASDSFKADREIVLEAVRSNGEALEYASDSLKADREIVLQAVKSNGLALEYAADPLKEDHELREIVYWF